MPPSLSRRKLLRLVGGTAATAIAGCAASDGSESDSPTGHTEAKPTTQDSSRTTTDGTDTATPASSQELCAWENQPSLSGYRLTTEERELGLSPNWAGVHFNHDPQPTSPRVRIVGLKRGPDTCAVAALDEVRYDGDMNALAVTIGTRDEWTDDTPTPKTPPACGQAIVSLRYKAVFDFEGGLPHTVTVNHAGVPEPLTIARYRC